jgi:hypothetical protein
MRKAELMLMRQIFLSTGAMTSEAWEKVQGLLQK